MTRCVIYARYSSDMQRDTSIEDQVRRCEEFAARQGWTVSRTFADRAISGSAMLGRQELQALLQGARNQPRPFDRVLIDDTSRLSRNVSEGAHHDRKPEVS
jgi:site-specific DNA recombinase